MGWHLLERSAGVPPATFTDGGQDARAPFAPVVEKITYAAETVWIDAALRRGFHPVPPAVWEFHIGGYQVCQKWLKDRKGRALSLDDLAHYSKIVTALGETIRLMAEIDEAIALHGGWPGAFANANVTRA